MEQLDGDIWPHSDFDSYVVQTSQALRKKPIRSLSDEELRLAIGQQIGLEWLEWLVRLALERLRDDPLLSGDFFPGDLLQNVLQAPDVFWTAHESEREAAMVIVKGLDGHDLPPSVRSAISRFAAKR
ncbi:contact-dependent growth inhibition system immunity protein [Inquilinus ginsengisoli]|uniref:contact-dependent growth inhibition system immunity protein n=1 Tax=Inquilinus ginsengisoli TaxID=363840 RepID=UPI003D212FAC